MSGESDVLVLSCAVECPFLSLVGVGRACSGILKAVIIIFDPSIHSRMRYAHRHAMARAWRGDIFIGEP